MNWKISSLKVFYHWRVNLRAIIFHCMVPDDMLTSPKVCHSRKRKNFVQMEISSKNQIQLIFSLLVWDGIGLMQEVFFITTMKIYSSGSTKRTTCELSQWKKVLISNVFSLGSQMLLTKSKQSSAKTVQILFSLHRIELSSLI